MRVLAGACAAVVALCLLPAAPAHAQLSLVELGKFDFPVFAASPPKDSSRLFVVEKVGRVRLIKDGALRPEPFLDVTGSVLDDGERGLLSMAFAPDYAATGLFYLYWTARDPVGEIQIVEFRRSAADPDRADPVGRIVLRQQHSVAPNHNGGQLQFGPDGYLYAGTGDGGGGNDPFNTGQSLAEGPNGKLAKILRIDPRKPAAGGEYAIPPDNPFAGSQGQVRETWSYGLRNPWRFSFDRLTGDLWIGDVGQGAWEEVDFSPASEGAGKGANWGWSCFEGTGPRPGAPPNCSAPGARPPVLQRSHDEGSDPKPCSITGGYVVRDPGLPSLVGRYLHSDYCDGDIRSFAVGGSDTSTGLDVAQPNSFGEDACGRLYVMNATTLFRIQEGPSPTPCTVQPDPPGSGGGGGGGAGGGSGGAVDSVAPTLTVRVASTRGLVSEGRLALRLRSSEAATARLTLRPNGARSSRRLSARVPAGTRGRLVRIRFSAAQRRALRARLAGRGRHTTTIRVTGEVVDAARNAAPVASSLRVSRR